MPKRLVATALLAALLWFFPSPPAGAAIPAGRYAIGDSVMLGARDDLVARGFRVNAHVSRQFRDAVGIVQNLKAAGKLRRKIVIHLGNNGILIEGSDCDRISNIAGSRRRVYLVNLKIPRSYRATQNRRLAACARRHLNTLLLDWFHLSKDHPSWFAADGYHLSSTGRGRYTSFLDAGTS
ncbi:MAG TPA: hypothetical protein VFA25_00200 [Actinomycetota bacterium]|nr:hypothetical protein [Actinomycetota bacterium]